MPSLPIVSGAEMVRVLCLLGFSVDRQRGSHVILRKVATGAAGAITVAVPVHGHKDLKTGTIRGILRQAGVGIAEFVEAR